MLDRDSNTAMQNKDTKISDLYKEQVRIQNKFYIEIYHPEANYEIMEKST